MKKCEIESFSKLKFRDGTYGLRMGNNIFLTDENPGTCDFFTHFDSFDENLNNDFNPNKDIIAVFPICSTSVWNRNEKLTLSERKYLETVISPFKSKVKFIKKQTAGENWEKLVIVVNEHTKIEFPPFKTGEFFNGMITDIPYTLKDLELEQEQNHE